MKDSQHKIKGMFRVNIVDPDGTVAGDSGWIDNIVTAAGVDDILNRIIDNSYTAVWEYAALGNGGEPSWDSTKVGTDASALESECSNSAGNVKRLDLNGTAGSYEVLMGSNKTLTGTNASRLALEGTFASNYYSATKSIQNIGLYLNSTNNELMCGNTYTQSTLATDQAVYITYQIKISQPS